MWYGFDAARKASVQVVDECGEQFVVVNGEEFPSHNALSLSSLSFSPGGRVAYAARDEDTWRLFIDRDSVFQARGEIQYIEWIATDTLIAVDANETHAELVVIRDDGGGAYRFRSGPAFDAIAKDAVLSRFGFTAYVGRRGGEQRVVVNDVVGPPFDGIAGLKLDRNGRPSYFARQNDDVWVARHGEFTGPFDNVAELVSDDSGERVVALIRSAEGWRADDGTWSSDAFDYIGDVRFSLAAEVAFRTGRGDQDFVIVGDRELGPYEKIEPGTLGFRDDHDVVFVIRSSDGVRVIDRGVASELWSEVREIVTNRRGSVGFIAERPDRTRVVVIDGIERGAWTGAEDLVFGQDGHNAFVTRRLGKAAVVANGVEYGFDNIVGGTLRFALDGSTWGVLALVNDQLALAMAGGRSVPIDLEELTGEILRRRDPKKTDAIVGAWISQKLEAALARPNAAQP
jgi:hypothetical protein